MEGSGGFRGGVARFHHRLTDGPPTRGRRILVWGLIALAFVLVFAASLTVWVERQVLNTDNWVDTSSELLADDEVRALVASDLVDALFAQRDVEERIASRLPPQLEGLAAPAAGLVRQAAVPAADNLLERPRVQELWANANRVAHSKLVAVLKGNEGGVVTTTGGEVVLDLGELVQRLADELGLNVQVADDAGQVQIADSEQLAAAQDAVKVIDALSVLVLIAVFVLLIVAVYLAAGFRRESLRGIAVGLILVGVILLVVQRLVGNALIDALTTDVSRPAGTSVWIIGTALLRDICIGLIVYGLVLLIGVLLAGPARWARWLRAKAAPVMRDRPFLAYGAVALVFLLILLWSPLNSQRSIWGTLVLAALVALGVWALRRQTLKEFPPAPS